MAGKASPAKAPQLFDLFADRVALENVYGPTECTCICSAYTIDPADFDDMAVLAPLGRLAQNFDHDILPLEPDQPQLGELLLRGPQIGLGYYRDPSARRLPRAEPAPQRLPRPGLSHGRPGRERDGDGLLHFRGRVDFQIKHMGYRIELEEIEFNLNTIAGCANAAWSTAGSMAASAKSWPPWRPSPAWNPPVAGDRQPGCCQPTWCPAASCCTQPLPKNANGKIDRTAELS